MLSLATLVVQLKRRSQYGDPDNTADQLTADVVHYINNRRLRLWRRYAWSWSVLEFTISLVAGTIDYVLAATIGDIVAIEDGQGGYFKKRTLKRYLQWHNGSSDTESDNPSDYVRMGMDANKSLMIKVWPKPASAANRSGWAKKRLVRYTVADLLTNTDLEYFPDEVLDVLEAGVLADIYEAQGKKADSDAKNYYFDKELEKMVKEETVEEDSEEQSDVPDYQTFHKRRRGGTTVT